MSNEISKHHSIEGTIGGVPFEGTLSDRGDLSIDKEVLIEAAERQLRMHRLVSRLFRFGFMSRSDREIEQRMIDHITVLRAS